MYIKKLVMYGFKSFPRKTEIPFTPGINVILGPNGSGKSNISDALCFVLGRLSIKSMRAAKAGNLIFLGTKTAAPSKFAVVEIVFDNTDRAFTIDLNEVSIKRIVKKNGQSIYKINNETKTRQEILTLLAQAGIDPNGFNIVLQGEIQNFVRMQSEERRKIIEEVSGISVYETRKEKSLKELEKTEEKLREINSILRERTAYLNNLEKERQQALKYQKLQADVKKFKASIIFSDLEANKKESQAIIAEIEKNNKEIEKIRKVIVSLRTSINNFGVRIQGINSTIQNSTGLEQERLNQEIANLRAELAGMNVRIESYESKTGSLAKQKIELQNNINETKQEIGEIEKSIVQKKGRILKNKEVDAKKRELEFLEESRKQLYSAKSEFKALKERLQDKNEILLTYKNESEFILKQINAVGKELFDKESSNEKLEALKQNLAEKKEILLRIEKREKELEKISYVNENEIEKQNKLIEKISKMDVCPLCKSKITAEHLKNIHQEIGPNIASLKKEIDASDKELSEIAAKKEMLLEGIEQISSEITKRNSDLVKLQSIEEKKNQIKTLQGKIASASGEIAELEKRRKYLEKKIEDSANIEQKYETAKVELQEISVRTEETVDSEISYKKMELERAKVSLNQILRDEKEVREDLDDIKKEHEEKETVLQNKKDQEERLSKKFQSLIAERESLQGKIRNDELEISKKENDIRNIENVINELKINRARFDAVVENLEIEMLGFKDIEIIKTKKEALVERLEKTEEVLSGIGTVNLRSLEVYDSIKKEYDAVKERTEVIGREKEGVLKIIHEIDIKKKKSFLKTLTTLNEIFSRNFSQLSTKGQVFLELENPKEPFDGGVGILVKTGHGKYFDVKSLSGGEQTLVALSLIFAIQEYNPYHFYMLDEIDAALDKRNSERLANLLTRYMQRGQYIVITHNDEVITNATNLYGISMHDGISKITSLKL